MIIKTLRIVILILLLTGPFVYAQKPSISTQYYYSKEGENLKQILEEIIGFSKKLLYGKENLFNKIKNWNPSIKNWDNLEAKTQIYLEYPFGAQLSPKKKTEPLSKPKLKTPFKERSHQKEPQFKPKFSMFSFFTVSKGTFKESLKANGESVSVESSQNSPISFGMGGAYFYKKEHTYSGSIYFSTLTGSVAADTEQEVEISPEIGTNFYYNYNFTKKAFSLYVGLDFEKFSTFNIDEIISGSTNYRSREHSIFFLTAGISKFFPLGKRGLLFKASISKSLLSSSSEAPKISSTAATYSGIKYLLYLNYKLSSNFLAHIIYKQHRLDGPTDLSVSRVGVGIGYKFF